MLENLEVSSLLNFAVFHRDWKTHGISRTQVFGFDYRSNTGVFSKGLKNLENSEIFQNLSFRI